MISPGYALMSKEFDMSYNALNGGLGWGVFVIGISCLYVYHFLCLMVDTLNAVAILPGQRVGFQIKTHSASRFSSEMS